MIAHTNNVYKIMTFNFVVDTENRNSTARDSNQNNNEMKMNSLPCSVGSICLFNIGRCTTCEPCEIIPTKGTETKTGL